MSDGWKYETSLWNFSTNSIVYLDELGYDDICLFKSAQEVADELNRVHFLTMYRNQMYEEKNDDDACGPHGGPPVDYDDDDDDDDDDDEAKKDENMTNIENWTESIKLNVD
jgi:hypothetical protein